MDPIKIVITCESETDETECFNYSISDASAIVLISNYYSEVVLIENEHKYGKKPTIYFGDKLVKTYVQLPYENVYDDDLEWGKICLFPKAKYEFTF